MSNVTFNDHLDDMMERLMNEDLSPEDLDKEIKRSKALCQIADKKIEDKKFALDFAKAFSEGDINENMIPTILTENLRQIGKAD